MQNTMHLLEAALKVQPAAAWHQKLKLSKNALHAAKNRGHLSPAIAGALAEELGEDFEKWIVIAALESERDSACKTRMVRKIATGIALTLGAASPTLANAVCILCKVDNGHQKQVSERLKRLSDRKLKNSLTK